MKFHRPAPPHPFEGRRAMHKLFVYAHLSALDLGDRLRRRLTSERGQGTVEYVGLILLVSLLMVGMVVAMKGFNSNGRKGGYPDSPHGRRETSPGSSPPA